MPIVHPVTGLTDAGCRARQVRVREVLQQHNLPAALLTHPAYVMYLTGYWQRQVYARVALVLADGPVVLAAPTPAGPSVFADETVVFESNHIGTIVDEQARHAVLVLEPWLRGLKTVGVDDLPRSSLLGDRRTVDLWPDLYELRRGKDADELALIATSIAGADAALAYARDVLHDPQVRITELELHARMHARAVEAVGEPIGELGNDYQSGTPGGPPRDRLVEVGELMPLDVGVCVRGYYSDFTRTFAVGGQPTDDQRAAHDRCVEVHAWFMREAGPGVSCRKLYDEARAMLDGYRGWSFPHHLGHGMGLMCHERPRLNPHHDDVLREGDVIAVEPGLYHAELRGGVRLEQNYHVIAAGLQRLTPFPDDL